ncbi:MAG: hypothetical protein IH600_15015 [Bacteroidetes bacterium]|nr:hypothetical protein [Bacteroidota bacterium]
MQSDFETFMNPPVPAASQVTKEDYSLAHGHIVKWGVLEILPLKSEIETLGEYDATQPVARLVPWEAGIIMRILALKSKDHRGNLRELFTQDPAGNITLPYGPKYMSQWVKVDRGEVERGWARQYNQEGRKLAYDFPPNWNQLSPMERYAYWLMMLGGRFGFPAGAIQPGSVFYAYFTRSKAKNGEKWFSDARKIYKGIDDQWKDECPAVFETMDINVLRKLYAKIDEEFNSSGFPYGQNAVGGSGNATDADPDLGW